VLDVCTLKGEERFRSVVRVRRNEAFDLCERGKVSATELLDKSSRWMNGKHENCFDLECFRLKVSWMLMASPQTLNGEPWSMGVHGPLKISNELLALLFVATPVRLAV
jgi:hypothetical protein